MNQLEKLLKEQNGTTAIEYALIAAIMGAALVSGLPVLTEAMHELLGEAAANLNVITNYVRTIHQI